ncbi:MAG: hypothetical protein QXG00_00760 [Candidatus Woesearchaeota archaeon]
MNLKDKLKNVVYVGLAALAINYISCDNSNIFFNQKSKGIPISEFQSNLIYNDEDTFFQSKNLKKENFQFLYVQFYSNNYKIPENAVAIINFKPSRYENINGKKYLLYPEGAIVIPKNNKFMN